MVSLMAKKKINSDMPTKLQQNIIIQLAETNMKANICLAKVLHTKLGTQQKKMN